MAPKIITMMLTYKRAELLVESVKVLRKQTVPSEIVIFGSADQDREAAERMGLQYFNSPNNSLIEKGRFALSVLKKMDADYILFMGDDEWASFNYCEWALEHGQRHGLVGVSFFHMLKCFPGKNWQLAIFKGRPGEPLGAGRLWSCKFLDKIDWNLWPQDRDRSFDGISFQRAVKKGCRVFNHLGTTDAQVLGLKGNWPMFDSWAHLMNKKMGDPTLLEVDPKHWIREHFDQETVDTIKNKVETWYKGK